MADEESVSYTRSSFVYHLSSVRSNLLLKMLKRGFHCFEQRLDCDLGLHLWDAGSLCYVVYYIQLNHESLRVFSAFALSLNLRVARFGL